MKKVLKEKTLTVRFILAKEGGVFLFERTTIVNHGQGMQEVLILFIGSL